MDYHQLLNFLAVCEEKSISKAAKRCFLTQQGLSSSIKLLEDELEVPLFNRTVQGIELTEFGIALREAAAPYMNHHDQIIDSIRRVKDSSRPVVSVGQRSGLYQLLPENFFANFMGSFPETVLKIRSFNGGACQKGMLEHNIHIGLIGEPVDSTLFDSFLWHTGSIHLVAGRNHPLAGRSSVKIEELKNETIITFNDETYPHNILIRACVQHGITPSSYLEGFELGLFHELCSSNRALAFWEGPMDTLPGFAKIEIEDLRLEWSAHLVVRKNGYLESVHNVDTLWTDFLKIRIFAAFRRENARSVHKVTDFMDRH
jgi:DNA-binding transcriptional LysR family regulator